MKPVRASLFLALLACTPSGQRKTKTDDPLVVGRSAGDAAAPEAREGVRFGHPPAKVGTRWHVSLDAESHAEDDGGPDQISHYYSEYAVEVLATAGPAPSRMSVHVARNVNTYDYTTARTPVDGKDYVVDVTRPHVRSASGAEAPPEEAQRVIDWFPDLGTRARIDEILPDEAIRIGDSRDELAAAIMRILHPRAWSTESGHAVLARAVGESAVFDVHLEANSQAGLRLWLDGTATVRLRDAWLVDLDLAGRYTESTGVGGAFKVRRTVTSD
jgi:hypothetical protein